jgi:hypothetical protein
MTRQMASNATRLLSGASCIEPPAGLRSNRSGTPLNAEFTVWRLAAVMSSDTWSCASARRFSGLVVAQRSHCVHTWSTSWVGVS